MRFLALFLLGLCLAPAASASAPACDSATLACSNTEETRRQGLAECRRELDRANFQHKKIIRDMATAREKFLENYSKNLPKLCNLKAKVAGIAQGTNAGPETAKAVPADCGRFGEVNSISERAAKPLEQLESTASKALTDMKTAFKETAQTNIKRAQTANIEALRNEVLGIWGTVDMAKLGPRSPLPEAGTFPRLLHHWESELESVRRNQAFLDNRGLSGQQLADRCRSLQGTGNPENPKGPGTGGQSQMGSGGTENPAPPAKGAGTATGTDTTEESWFSRNSTALMVGTLGIGAATVAGVLYYQNQQNKKLSKDATAAVQEWATRSSEAAKEAEQRAKDRDEKSAKANVIDFDKSDLSPMEAGGKTLYFFPPVATLLDRIATNASAETVTPATTTCPAHIEMATNPAMIAGKDSCSAEKEALKELAKSGSICFEVQTPVEQLANLDPSEPDPLEMDKMEEILKLYGPALKRMQLFGAFQRQEYYDTLTSAIVKVRMDKIRETLEKRRSYFVTVNKNLLKGGDCFKGTAEEKRKAVTLYARAYDEVLALLYELGQIESLGVSRVLSEGNKLQARGKSIPKLPYPSLTESERAFLTTSLSGFLWRSRGGGIFHEPTNTNIRRVTFTLQPMSELARVNAGEKSSWLGTELWIKLFTPWGEYHDMGRKDGDKESDYQAMRSRGVEQVSGVASQAKSQGYDQTAILQSGPMMGDCYWYGYERAGTLKMGANLDNERPFQHAMVGPSQWGEFCTGLSFGYGLSRSLLLGR